MTDSDRAWIYVMAKIRRGPATASEIAMQISGEHLVPETLVWKPGMATWARACDVPEIACLCAPPVPTAEGSHSKDKSRQPRARLLLRLWRGELGLASTFWGWLLPANAYWLVMAASFDQTLREASELFFLPAFGYSCLVSVGVWKAANLYVGPRKWARGAKVHVLGLMSMGLISLLALIDGLLGDLTPPKTLWPFAEAFTLDGLAYVVLSSYVALTFGVLVIRPLIEAFRASEGLRSRGTLGPVDAPARTLPDTGARGGSPDAFTFGSWAFVLSVFLMNKVTTQSSWSAYGQPPTLETVAYWVSLAEKNLLFTLRSFRLDPFGTLSYAAGGATALLLFGWPVASLSRAILGKNPSARPSAREFRIWLHFALPAIWLALLTNAVSHGAVEYFALLFLSIPLSIGLYTRSKLAWILSFMGIFLAANFVLTVMLAFGPIGSAAGGAGTWMALTSWKRTEPFFRWSEDATVLPSLSESSADGDRRRAITALSMFGLFLALTLFRDHNYHK